MSGSISLDVFGERLRTGFDERFVRLWTYYLGYCEVGFDEHYVDDLQIVLAKPAWRPTAAPGPSARDTERVMESVATS